MTVENDQFRAFFRMVPQKLAISRKRGRFRAKSLFIKVVVNAIFKIFYLMTFFLGRISKPEKTIEAGLFLLILGVFSLFSLLFNSRKILLNVIHECPCKWENDRGHSLGDEWLPANHSW